MLRLIRSKFPMWGLKLAWIVLIVCLGIWIYRSYLDGKKENRLQIAESPIFVESVREIAELAVLGMEEECVLDTVEYYQDSDQAFKGNAYRLKNIKNVANIIHNSDIKRRLTLIVNAKAKIGFDLNANPLRIDQSKDTVWLHCPKPRMLDLEMNPTRTKVFIEIGVWSDSERKNLYKRIQAKVQARIHDEDLLAQVKRSFEKLVPSLIRDERKILIYFD